VVQEIEKLWTHHGHITGHIYQATPSFSAFLFSRRVFKKNSPETQIEQLHLTQFYWPYFNV